MAGFDFKLKSLKGGFFDVKKITSAVDKANAKVQSKFGAYARKVMRNSIKYKPFNEWAAAGQPPFAHRSDSFSREKTNRKTGAVGRQKSSPLRELIVFARDPSTGSVVIGPVAFGAHGAAALEHGGTATFRTGKKGGTKSVTIAAHPFAAPAGQKTEAQLPELLNKMVN